MEIEVRWKHSRSVARLYVSEVEDYAGREVPARVIRGMAGIMSIDLKAS